MHKKNGRIYATLTEVKNLIGDVFAAVDEHGEVAITSYNKAKYIITKAPAPEMSDLIEEMPIKKVSKKQDNQPVKKQASAVAKFAPQEVAVVVEPIAVVEVETIAVSPAVLVTEIVAPIETSVKPQNILNLLDVFKDASEREMFNRFNNKETDWINQIKLNF